MSLTDFKKTTIGDLMNRLSEDVVAVRMYLGPGVMYVVNLLILLIITSIYMLKTSEAMTLWSLLPPVSYTHLDVYKRQSLIPRKIEIALSVSGSSTITFWKRLSNALSFSKYF